MHALLRNLYNYGRPSESGSLGEGCRFDPWIRTIPWRRNANPFLLVFSRFSSVLTWRIPRPRSLEDSSPWSRKVRG